MVPFSFIRLTISTTPFYWAPAEDAGWWPLPQSVFVPVGSEDANRLGSWERRRGAAQQGGIGSPQSGWSAEHVRGVEPVFTRKGRLGASSPFMPRIPSVPRWQRGRRGSGVTSSPESHCRDSLALTPAGNPGEWQHAQRRASETLPRLRGSRGKRAGLGRGRRPSQNMWGGGGNRNPQ